MLVRPRGHAHMLPCNRVAMCVCFPVLVYVLAAGKVHAPLPKATLKGVRVSSQMVRRKFVLPPSSSDDDALSPGLALGEEEVGGSRVQAPVGARAVINPPGTLLDAVRMRTHSPPPVGWVYKSEVVMGDGATAADLAIDKVFLDGQPLPDILGSEGAVSELSARTHLPLCSCVATCKCLRLRKHALHVLVAIAQVSPLLRRLSLLLSRNG